MIIAVDFDGTCCTHEFPLVGKDIGAVPVLKKLVMQGHLLILFTMRSDKEKIEVDNSLLHATPGKYLAAAVEWFDSRGIPLYGIQTNPSQSRWTDSPKVYAQMYIDDAALGCPLAFDQNISERPFADWAAIEQLLINRGVL